MVGIFLLLFICYIYSFISYLLHFRKQQRRKENLPPCNVNLRRVHIIEKHHSPLIGIFRGMNSSRLQTPATPQYTLLQPLTSHSYNSSLHTPSTLHYTPPHYTHTQTHTIYHIHTLIPLTPLWWLLWLIAMSNLAYFFHANMKTV